MLREVSACQPFSTSFFLPPSTFAGDVLLQHFSRPSPSRRRRATPLCHPTPCLRHHRVYDTRIDGCHINVRPNVYMLYPTELIGMFSAHAPDGRDYGNVWKWGHTGNMQSGVSADTEAMEELGHQVRNADAQTVQFAPETQVDEVADAQAEVVQGAQADGQVAMGNPVVITQGAAPPRIHSARSSELCAAPGFMSSRPMPPRVVVCN